MDKAEFLEGIGCREYESAFDAFPLTEEVRNAFFSDFPSFAHLGESNDDPGLFFLSFFRLFFSLHMNAMRDIRSVVFQIVSISQHSLISPSGPLGIKGIQAG